MATRAHNTKTTVGATGSATDAQFVDRMVEFKTHLAVIEGEIGQLKREFSEAGKALRNKEKEKSDMMEEITKYVLSAQKDLI